jgi:hypothetical protein
MPSLPRTTSRYSLGICLALGLASALQLLESLANQGVSKAQGLLARMYGKG